MQWSISKIWQGESCYIIGGGFSLKDFDASILRGKNIIAINNAFEFGDFIQICFFGDKRWHNDNKEELQKANYLSIVATYHPVFKQHPDVHHVNGINNRKGIETSPNTICTNYNSGFSAINLAYHLGVTTIILLGFDMRPNPDKIQGNNFHQKHKIKVKCNPYPTYLKAVQPIAEDAKRLGLTILNTTKNSAIPTEFFPYIDIERVL